MKKRLLLAILPALLALSSCSAQPKAKAEPQFLEDTLAHEEVFGGNDNGEYLYKGTKLNFDDCADVPTDDNLRPAIGVQHQLDSTEQYISIRFVAAIKVSGALSDTTAVWTRAMYKPDGSILKDFATKSSLKAYEEINNGSSALHITTFNGSYETHYNYFVVYTMLNIKLADYANCYLNAYLTLGDGKETLELAVPIRTDISANNVWKFEASQRYFIRLNPFATNQEDFAQDTTTQGSNPSNNYASFSHTFGLANEFVIVANDVANKRFKIYDSSCLTGANNTIGNYFGNAGGHIKVNEAGKYILYLNKSGELWHFLYEDSGIYIRGEVVGDSTFNQLKPAYQLTTSPDSNNICEIYNASLSTGNFKIANSDWSFEVGFWGVRHDNQDDWLDNRSPRVVMGGASSCFTEGSDSGRKNIYCNTAGNYNIFVTKNYYVYFEYAA